MKLNYYIFISVIIGVWAITGCGNTPNHDKSVEGKVSSIEIDTTKVEKMIADGTAAHLLQTNCYTCHQPNSTSHDDIIAPPLVGVKYRYKKAFSKKEDFIDAMTHFIVHPSKENALMRGPVRRFGLMPPTVLKPNEIQAVVTYLHETEIESPEWFAAHFEEQHGETWIADHRAKGKEIAGATFGVLAQNLQQAMKAGGVPNAVTYCNAAAYPITDSLASVHNAIIKRTTTKTRNPNNTPTKLEQEILATYATMKANGETLKPVVKTVNEGEVAFFAPIIINDLCLKCHGKIGETIKEADYTLIKELYPNDEAIGYQAGDLRGMWSITFKE